MRVAGQDHVNAGHDTGHLLVHIKAIVAQHNHTFRTGGAYLFDHRRHVFIADAKGILREHPARVSDGHIREGLSDHRNLGAAAFKHFVGLEQLGRLVPFGIEDVLSKCSKGQPLDNLVHTLRAEREFPMECHGVRLERVHDVHHVLPFGL